MTTKTTETTKIANYPKGRVAAPFRVRGRVMPKSSRDDACIASTTVHWEVRPSPSEGVTIKMRTLSEVGR